MVINAKVQWWDAEDVVVLCPFCKENHRHFLTKDDGGYIVEYDQSSLREAPCTLDALSGIKSYALFFPFEHYEIDKPFYRFIAHSYRRIIDTVSLPPLENGARTKNSASNIPLPPLENWARTKHSASSIPQEELEIDEAEYMCPLRAFVKSSTRNSARNARSTSSNPEENEVPNLETYRKNVAEAKAKYKSKLGVCLRPNIHRWENREQLEQLNEAALTLSQLYREAAHALRMCVYKREQSTATVVEVDGEASMDAKHPIEGGTAILPNTARAPEEPTTNNQVSHSAEESGQFVSLAKAEASLRGMRKDPRSWTKTPPTGGLLYRGEQYTPILEVSGFKNSCDHYEKSLLDPAFMIAKEIDLPFPVHRSDKADTPGKYNASHVEAKLVAYFVLRHVFLAEERRHLEAHDPQQYERLTRLGKLWKVRPKMSCVAATIIVDHAIGVCESCQKFIRNVNEKLGLRIEARILTKVEQAAYDPLPSPQGSATKKVAAENVDELATAFGTLSVDASTHDGVSQFQSATTPKPRTISASSRGTTASPGRSTPMPIVCYNCGGGHYSTYCSSPKSSLEQQQIYRAKADRIQLEWKRKEAEQETLLVGKDETDVSSVEEVTSLWPRTPPRRPSAPKTLYASPRSPSYVPTGSRRSPHRPVICYNCGEAHYSTNCLSPKATPEQRQAYRKDAQRQQAEWTRRMSEQLATPKKDPEDDSKTRQTQSMSPALQPRRLFGSQ